MKKVIGKTVLVSLVIGIIVWIASLIFSFSYSQWGFYIGLGLTLVLLIFNTSGGTTMANFEASESIWKIQKNDDLKINVGVVFYGAILYTVVSLIPLILI